MSHISFNDLVKQTCRKNLYKIDLLDTHLSAKDLFQSLCEDIEKHIDRKGLKKSFYTEDELQEVEFEAYAIFDMIVSKIEFFTDHVIPQIHEKFPQKPYTLH